MKSQPDCDKRDELPQKAAGSVESGLPCGGSMSMNLVTERVNYCRLGTKTSAASTQQGRVNYCRLGGAEERSGHSPGGWAQLADVLRLGAGHCEALLGVHGDGRIVVTLDIEKYSAQSLGLQMGQAHVGQ